MHSNFLQPLQPLQLSQALAIFIQLFKKPLTQRYTLWAYSLHQSRAIRLILQSLFSSYVKLCNSVLSVHVNAIW